VIAVPARPEARIVGAAITFWAKAIQVRRRFLVSAGPRAAASAGRPAQLGVAGDRLQAPVVAVQGQEQPGAVQLGEDVTAVGGGDGVPVHLGLGRAVIQCRPAGPRTAGPRTTGPAPPKAVWVSGRVGTVRWVVTSAVTGCRLVLRAAGSDR